jgi:hypothetical protein
LYLSNISHAVFGHFNTWPYINIAFRVLFIPKFEISIFLKLFHMKDLSICENIFMATLKHNVIVHIRFTINNVHLKIKWSFVHIY